MAEQRLNRAAADGSTIHIHRVARLEAAQLGHGAAVARVRFARSNVCHRLASWGGAGRRLHRLQRLLHRRIQHDGFDRLAFLGRRHGLVVPVDDVTVAGDDHRAVAAGRLGLLHLGRRVFRLGGFQRGRIHHRGFVRDTLRIQVLDQPAVGLSRHLRHVGARNAKGTGFRPESPRLCRPPGPHMKRPVLLRHLMRVGQAIPGDEVLCLGLREEKRLARVHPLDGLGIGRYGAGFLGAGSLLRRLRWLRACLLGLIGLRLIASFGGGWNRGKIRRRAARVFSRAGKGLISVFCAWSRAILLGAQLVLQRLLLAHITAALQFDRQLPAHIRRLGGAECVR